MPDRVKETVFNILGSRYGCPGALPPLSVADVFSGSGSMGLDSLSRGAASCSFFERDRDALEALRRNLAALDVGEIATVRTGNAWEEAVLDRAGQPFDLVFLDPPYSDSQDTSEAGCVARYLSRLGEGADSKPLVVLHHRAKFRFETVPAPAWQLAESRTFGTHAITLLKR